MDIARLPTPDYVSADESVVLYCADCLDILPQIPDGSLAIVTDPPYPDQHTELYGYRDGLIQQAIGELGCRQLVFWSARVDFPMSHSAVHIWDKVVGCASTYERIFERNGSATFQVFRALLLSSRVQAAIMRDDFTEHPSQKPVQLIKKLLQTLRVEDTILDPFLGSGTTAVACIKTGRSCIGIEKEPKYFDIAVKRVEEAFESQSLFRQAEAATA